MYRVDVTDDNLTWASNQLQFEKSEEAEEYAIGLSWRWLAVKGYRVVPTDHPKNEIVDYEASADAGFIVCDLT